MPEELIQLCSQIADQKNDPVKLNALVEQLMQLLTTEQQTIKADMRAQLTVRDDWPYLGV